MVGITILKQMLVASAPQAYKRGNNTTLTGAWKNFEPSRLMPLKQISTPHICMNRVILTLSQSHINLQTGHRATYDQMPSEYPGDIRKAHCDFPLITL